MTKKSLPEKGRGSLRDFAPLGVCDKCLHFDPGSWTCAAFPDEIPSEILRGDNDHQKPFPGDRGIQFEPRPLTALDKFDDLDD